MHGNLLIKPTQIDPWDWYMYTHICLNLMLNVGKYTIHEDSMGNAMKACKWHWDLVTKHL